MTARGGCWRTGCAACVRRRRRRRSPPRNRRWMRRSSASNPNYRGPSTARLRPTRAPTTASATSAANHGPRASKGWSQRRRGGARAPGSSSQSSPRRSAPAATSPGWRWRKNRRRRQARPKRKSVRRRSTPSPPRRTANWRRASTAAIPIPTCLTCFAGSRPFTARCKRSARSSSISRNIIFI